MCTHCQRLKDRVVLLLREENSHCKRPELEEGKMLITLVVGQLEICLQLGEG